jgi:hypothetical protein
LLSIKFINHYVASIRKASHHSRCIQVIIFQLLSSAGDWSRFVFAASIHLPQA